MAVTARSTFALHIVAFTQGRMRASLITNARSPRARCSTGPCAAPYVGAQAGDGEACSLSTVIGHPFDPTDAGRLTNSKELQVGEVAATVGGASPLLIGHLSLGCVNVVGVDPPIDAADS